MKWLTNLLFALLLLSGAALGQAFTQVSGQAKDAQGNLYVNCVFSIHFIGQSSQPGPYLFQGSVFQQTYAGVRCDGFGNFAIRLPSNQAIFPQPSGWEFNICDASGHFCNGAGTGIITIAGSSQDITAIMSPLLPILPPVTGEVRSIFGRTGQVVAVAGDYNVSQVTGAAPLNSPVFAGVVQVPTAPVGTFSPQAASTAFVMTAIGNAISGGGGGGGGGWNPPTAPGDTLFGNNTLSSSVPSFFIPGGDISFSSGNFSVNQLHFGPNALSLTNQGIATGNCLQVSGSNIIGGACGTGSGGGVTTFNGRNGAVVPQLNDYSFSQLSGTVASNQLASSLNLPGVPTAATAPVGTNSTQLATTAFVLANQGGSASIPGLSSDGTTLTFSGSGGIVTPKFTITQGPFQLTSVTGSLPNPPATGQNGLVSGSDGWYFSNNGGPYTLLGSGGAGAPLNSPAFTGTPTAPTAAQSVNNTQLATTAFVHAAVAAVGGGPGAGVTSFNGRQGIVTAMANDYAVAEINGAAPINTPNFTGAPTAPTPDPADNSDRIATTAWVKANAGGGGTGPSGPVPISRSVAVCGANSVASVLEVTVSVNISTGDTVIVSVMNNNSNPNPTVTTVTDDAAGGTNAYTLRTTKYQPLSGSRSTLNVLATDPSAAKAATTITIRQDFANKFAYCVAAYAGVHAFGSTPSVDLPYSASIQAGTTQTATLAVQDGGILFTAFGVAAAGTATIAPGTVIDQANAPAPSTAANAICEHASSTAATVSCTVTWSVSNLPMIFGALTLIPGVTAAPLYPGPKVVAYKKTVITVTTTAFRDVPLVTCSATDCPAGYYRIAWDVLSLTSCPGGYLNVNVNYFDEFDLVNPYRTGMISAPGASITTARNHVFGTRLMTVAKTLDSTTGIALTTSADSGVTTPASSSQCTSGTGTAQVAVTIERLQ